MKKKKIVAFIHVYYEDTLEPLLKQLKAISTLSSASIYMNICCDNPNFNEMRKAINNIGLGIHLIKASNKGKDIGGKMAMLATYLRLGENADYMLFLHDKKSPQLAHGNDWQTKLFDIASKSNIAKVIEMFEDPKIGMIGSKDHIMNKDNETDEKLFVNNKEFVFREAEKFELKSNNYGFVGGTMFWVRESVFKDFFIKNDPLSIRKSFERGNVMDDFGPTYTHSWERLLGWIITTYGLVIRGV